MPYRRLPNTDQARLRALKAALSQYKMLELSDLLFSQKTALDVASETPMFEQAVQQYVDCKEVQISVGRQLAESGRLARLYLSHFIQVFNMCVARGEIKPEMRDMLGLAECGASVPDLSSDQQLIEWGRVVVEGEEKRMSVGGGNRIYNPSIALVKIKLDNFVECYNRHRDILTTIQRHQQKLVEERVKADEVILQIWNEVEERVGGSDTEEKREQCQNYGIVYFFRPQERAKDFLSGQL